MEYWLGVATLVGIYMIAVLGVSILCGFTGMFSMGHAGFMAIGAYTSALLTKNFDMPVFSGSDRRHGDSLCYRSHYQLSNAEASR